MSAPLPLPMVYEGDGLFRVRQGFVKRCEEQYGAGECVTMAEVEAQDTPRRRAFFATVRDIWRTLPERWADEHPTADALRKRALIATGWRDQETHVCTSKAEAQRLASALRRHMSREEWPVITVSNCVVVVLTAKSQKMRAMNAEDFNASSEAVLKHLAQFIGSEVEQLPKTEAA